MAEAETRAAQTGAGARAAAKSLLAFLKLGLTSFGGPIAHIGYFRSEFVARRGWLSERAFADLVALAQFLPGPASSQVGFAIGLTRAGWLGGLAAWAGFTLPSAALMLAFAYGAAGIADLWWGAGLLHGLKLMAVAVIAQAVLGMAKSFCADAPRAAIAAAALALVAFVPGSLAQLAAIVGGALAGLAAVRGGEGEAADDFAPHLSRRAALVALALFLALLALSFLPAGAGLAGARRRVLSLRRAGVRRRPCRAAAAARRVGCAGACCRRARSSPAMARRRRCRGRCSPWRPVSARSPERRRPGSPAASSRWRRSSCRGCWRWSPRCRSGARCGARRMRKAAMAGINAAVVGLLAAALYNPAFVSAVLGPARFRRRGGGVRAARRRARAAAPRRRPRRGGGRGARRVKRRITPPSSVP